MSNVEGQFGILCTVCMRGGYMHCVNVIRSSLFKKKNTLCLTATNVPFYVI